MINKILNEMIKRGFVDNYDDTVFGQIVKRGVETVVYKGSLESHVRAGRLSEKDARNIAKLLQIDFDLNKKIPWWKKIFHKN